MLTPMKPPYFRRCRRMPPPPPPLHERQLWCITRSNLYRKSEGEPVASIAPHPPSPLSKESYPQSDDIIRTNNSSPDDTNTSSVCCYCCNDNLRNHMIYSTFNSFHTPRRCCDKNIPLSPAPASLAPPTNKCVRSTESMLPVPFSDYKP